jgi:hypothetical protein
MYTLVYAFFWIYMFYAEVVKKLLLVSFKLGFESL